MLFNADYASGRLVVEYDNSSRLRIIKNEASDFSRFLEAAKSGRIIILRFGYGESYADKEVQNPMYEKLENFFKNRISEFYRLRGAVKSGEVKSADAEFLIESETMKSRLHDIRIYATKAVADYLENLLSPSSCSARGTQPA